jgi:DeoR/GlpR family transcriptional regulator of sugar metabolism
MNARDRRDEIARMVLDQGRIQVTELTHQFGVTDTSIRHDLALLEDMGLLRRIHGGAITTSHALQMADRSERMSRMASEKKRIAHAALNYLRSSEVVIMDSGSTVLQLGRVVPPALRRPGALRIVTNSIPLVEEVGTWASPNLLLLGGIFLPDHLATVGPDTLDGLQHITAQCAFLGCDGMTRETGITTAHPLIAEVGRAMAARAERVVVLADSSKLERAGFVPIIPLEQLQVFITGREAPQDVVAQMRERGVEVILA